MGMKYKNVGGQAAPGSLGQGFSDWLQQGLMGNGFGGGSQNGMSGILNSVLGGGAGTLGGALQSILQTQQTNDINNIRSRYGVGGGTGFGTPAAYGEATYRAQAAPQITSAIGNLQLGAINSLLPYINSVAGRQTPQAQTVGQQNPWMQAAGLILPVAGQVAGASMGGGGASMNMIGGGGQMQPMNLDFSGFQAPNFGGAGQPGMSMPGMGSYSPFMMNGMQPNLNFGSFTPMAPGMVM